MTPTTVLVSSGVRLRRRRRGVASRVALLRSESLSTCVRSRSPLQTAQIPLENSQLGVGNRSRARLMSGLSNTRLKLTAPVVCGRIAFMNVKAWRRSLSAIR